MTATSDLEPDFDSPEWHFDEYGSDTRPYDWELAELEDVAIDADIHNDLTERGLL